MMQKLKQFIASPKSLPMMVTITLVTITTFAMVIFGTLNYYYQYKDTKKQADAELQMISNQLSSSLTQPMLTSNHPHAAALIESFMQNKNVFAIVVKDRQHTVAALTRDHRWHIVHAEGDIRQEDKLLHVGKNIIHKDQTLGTVEIFYSQKFIREAFIASILSGLLNILIFNIILIAVLFFTLMFTVIRPLRALEQYAVKISETGGHERVYIPYARFTREMSNLKEVIEEMVRQNNARYLELNRSQTALRDTEAKYRGIFQNAAEGIFQIAPDGRVLTVNPALADMLGYDSPEALQRALPDAFHNMHFRRDFKEIFLSVIEKQGYVKDFEYTIRRLDGQSILVSGDAHIIRNERGAVMYYEGMIRDVTTRKRLEEMRIASETAEKTARSKNIFLANISHEIRTPMNAILGFSALALKESLPAKLRDYLNTITRSAKNMLHLIDDILDFSKIEADKLNIESVNFCLDDIIENISSIVSLKTSEKGIEFISLIDNDVPRNLIGDPHRLGQILLNLTGNAVKFTSAGYTMLRVENVHHDSIRCTLKFLVKDTGIGIPRDHLCNLFLPFSQADPSVTRRFGGTGLGLAICRHLAEMMGGQIGVESEIGKGSTFFVTLPFLCRQETAEPRTGESRRENPPGTELWTQSPGGIRGACVLLVEDNVINQQLTCEILQAGGVNVYIADNGRAALEKLRTQDYDAVLMDIQMPEMSGYETTAAIRDHPAWKDLPIIAMTAHAMAKDKEECLNAGMNDYITKPLDPILLMDILDRWIAPRPPGIRPDGESRPAMSAPLRTNSRLPAALPGINVERGIKRLQGNQRLYIKLLLAFSEKYENAPAIVEQALQTGDVDAAARITHTIKGVAGNLSLEKLAACADLLTDRISNAHPDAAALLQDSFTKEHAIVRTSISCLAATAACQDPPQDAETPLEIQDLQSVFTRLYESLKMSDLKAAAQFLPLKIHLKDGLFVEDIYKIEKDIDSLNYQSAMDALRRLAHKNNIPLGGYEN
jgi:PAS domain S-box-containing protein